MSQNNSFHPTSAGRLEDLLEQIDAAWRAAYYIAWIGASNPKGVANSIAEHSQALGADHPAVVAMQGHLDYLNGESLGPEIDVLAEVMIQAKRLGLSEKTYGLDPE